MNNFAHYKIISQIGSGGMGKVYKAYDSKLERTVALKVLISQHCNKQRERFLQEAKSTARLSHPNIIRLYEVGEYNNLCFFSMEFIDGSTLKSFITDNKISLRKSCKILSKIAYALQYTHKEGIIHRDLKPSNIMVSPKGEPILMDFGIAKDFRKKAHTKTGEVVGTLYYMSPEQAGGRKREIDYRTDIYSLGVILYQVATKKLPYHATTQYEIITKIIQGKLKIPSLINRRLPKAIDAICLKSMAKNKERRYASAEAFALDLEKVSKGENVSVSARKNQAKFYLGGLIVLLLLATYFYSSDVPKKRESPSDKKMRHLHSKVNTLSKEVDNIYNQLKWTDVPGWYVESFVLRAENLSELKLVGVTGLSHLNKIVDLYENILFTLNSIKKLSPNDIEIKRQIDHFTLQKKITKANSLLIQRNDNLLHTRKLYKKAEIILTQTPHQDVRSLWMLAFFVYAALDVNYQNEEKEILKESLGYREKIEANRRYQREYIEKSTNALYKLALEVKNVDLERGCLQRNAYQWLRFAMLMRKHKNKNEIKDAYIQSSEYFQRAFALTRQHKMLKSSGILFNHVFVYTNLCAIDKKENLNNKIQYIEKALVLNLGAIFLFYQENKNDKELPKDYHGPYLYIYQQILPRISKHIKGKNKTFEMISQSILCIQDRKVLKKYRKIEEIPGLPQQIILKVKELLKSS
ncbi:serine/threonine protein kinase [Candidatus Uabimicrobium sp. HlEnr_7]|uniref:serine/threonine protein kinase n=1 Tax=Candidatus Uabimicrobium helgolandensis TaxID=3095367 RepID=UPI0035567DFB